MGPTVEVVVLIRAMVSLAATARKSMEATTRALTATLAHITREDMAATVKPSQVEGDAVTGSKSHDCEAKFDTFLSSQVDTVLHHLIKEEVVAMVIQVSPIALEPITTTASPPT